MNMPIVAKLRSFHRRRIRLPVDEHALVLDVGSGDKPSWRADVLLDGYPDDPHAGQRSGTGRTRVDRPLFDADAAAMPFADGAFDYVICSHVLEHVPDPSAVIAELTRVASAGYIEVPEAAAAKLIDFPTHLWWCRLDRTADPAELVFTAKTQPYFDAEIDEYLTRTGIARPLARQLEAAHPREPRGAAVGGVRPAPGRGHARPGFHASYVRRRRAAPRSPVGRCPGADQGAGAARAPATPGPV